MGGGITGKTGIPPPRFREHCGDMRKPNEQLHHDGVDLRRWRLEDAAVAFRVVTESLDHLAPWMPWASTDYDLKTATDFVSSSRSDWEQGKAFDYAVLGPGSDVIGSASLMARIGPGGLEIGYWLHRDHVGRGIVRRAARALVDEAFRIGADHVEIVHDEANLRSRAIPEALGFTQVDRRDATDPPAPACTGVQLVWRLAASEAVQRSS